MRVLTVVLTLAAFAASVAACAGGQSSQPIPSAGQPEEQTQRELEALPAPPAVDAELFSLLKQELARELRAHSAFGKLTATPPSGPENRVSDLLLVDEGGGAYTLEWTYRNAGDYNQDGTVSIADVTPIAIHFGETSSPANEWIDGSGNDRIDISDVTAIARHFRCDVARYSVQAAAAYPGDFAEILSVPLPEAGAERLHCSASLDGLPGALIVVVPYDSEGNPGEYSNFVGAVGSIEGLVTNAVTSMPLEGAVVSVVGTPFQAVADASGYYLLAGIPAGEWTVEAAQPGYESLQQPCTVTAGAVSTLDFALAPLGGNIYYVSPTGDDGGAGTEADPWATPGFGSHQLQPGDTLVIGGGTYILSEFGTHELAPTSGTPEARIYIVGEAGNRPVLAMRDNMLCAVELSNVSYVTLQNLEITTDNLAWGRDGIEALGGPVSHVVLDGIYIHHIDEYGLNLADPHHVAIQNCDFEYCGFGGIGGPAGMAGGWQDVLIDHCRLAYSGHYYQGLFDNPDNPYDRPDGFGIEPGEGPLEIRYCTAEHNRGDGLDSKAANTWIHHCIVANNSCDGVKVWGHDSRIENTLIYGTGDGVGGPSPWAGIVIAQVETANARFDIVNVTVHDNPTREAYPVYLQYPDPEDPTTFTPIQVVMRNTIIAGGQGVVYSGDVVDFAAEHCLFWRPGEEYQAYANGQDYTASQINAGDLGAGNLCAEPLFVAPAWGTPGDYHLQDGSPGIDDGAATDAPADDLDGTARPQGAGYDIGAYER